jgi:uncharacterized membrane protein
MVDDEITAPARWKVVTALVLSLLGLGIASYLTYVHFQPQALVCSDSGVINCQKVTTSAQSHFLGIPVAILGLGYYLVMVAFNLPAAWRATDRRVHMARLALSGLGMAFALYLVAAELVIIGSICIWCTGVHVVTFLLFVLIVTTVPAMLGWGAPAYDD